jgi:hypothetical protein
VLGLRFRLITFIALAAFCATAASAQETSKISLERSETLFTVVTAMNVCGYDQEVGVSAPVRGQIRSDIAKAVQQSHQAADAVNDMCVFYRDHQQRDAARDLSQYISLALNLGEPPEFSLAVSEADVPPDGAYVLGFVPLMKRFYETAGLHQIWLKHQPEYEQLVDANSPDISKMLLATDVYLRQQISGYLGRVYRVYIEPMAAPSQINARNFGPDYYLVMSPEAGKVPMIPIRHTYLHYILDPMALKRGGTVRSLQPVLELAKDAPMEPAFKKDTALWMTECLIRAIEARTAIKGKGKEAERQREQLVEIAVKEGFTLTHHFNDELRAFEDAPEGLQNAYGNWLHDIRIDNEKKRARETQYAAQAQPEIMQASRPLGLVIEAEKRLASGDIEQAKTLAEQALHEKREEPQGALFVLARVAALSGDMKGAQQYFNQTLSVASAPRIVAWSHIYLARILDMQAGDDPAKREEAIKHYQAALQAGHLFPGATAAAQKGLKEPYQPPAAAQHEKQQSQDDEKPQD